MQHLIKLLPYHIIFPHPTTISYNSLGIGWDRFNFIHSSTYGALFWICNRPAEIAPPFQVVLLQCQARPFLTSLHSKQTGRGYSWGSC